MYFDAVQLEPDDTFVRDLGRHPTGIQIADQLRLVGRTEPLDTGDDTGGVPAPGERFHEQPVGPVAAAMRWIVERIVREQNPHLYFLRKR